jgi:hypothetical protein
MSPKSAQRFWDNDMRKNKDLSPPHGRALKSKRASVGYDPDLAALPGGSGDRRPYDAAAYGEVYARQRIKLI